ncbi:MAG: selenide, water dikinase SelD, partial [Ilumatobacteraceae bacterium]
GDPRNRDYVAGHLRSSASAAGEALCMDPQTSGGLLVAIDPAAVASLSDMWWRVGEVAAGDPAIVLR